MTAARPHVVAIGEAMLELAPVGDGQYRLGYAGDTYNTIWHLAQLLGPRARASFATRIGTDAHSDRFVRELELDGLDPANVSRDPERQMGLYLIELDGAERSFHYWREHSAARRLADDREALAEALSASNLIHVSGITLAILDACAHETLFTALDAARRNGARVCFDPNIRPRLWASADEIRDTVARMLSLTDIALPSFDDERAIWNDATPMATIARMRTFGISEIAIKDGAQPVHLFSEGATYRCETPPAPILRDTTGAGDAFNAGYLAARLVGIVAADAVAFGQTLAAHVLATPGARAPVAIVRDMARTLDDRMGPDKSADTWVVR
jgi:2-dehydro-3-deoxygluconokinase